MANDKAKLRYPVGLIIYNEWRNIGTASDQNDNKKTNEDFWNLSSGSFSKDLAPMAGISFVDENGKLLYHCNSHTIKDHQ